MAFGAKERRESMFIAGHDTNLSSSYKRMAVWEKETKSNHKEHDKMRQLQNIIATRWWSKHRTLSSIIDEEFLDTEGETNTSKLIKRVFQSAKKSPI